MDHFQLRHRSGSTRSRSAVSLIHRASNAGSQTKRLSIPRFAEENEGGRPETDGGRLVDQTDCEPSTRPAGPF